MSSVTISNIKKSYGDVSVLQNILLNIEDGEFIAFVGPSGCGKSTLLRIIAGLEKQCSGSIKIDNKIIDNKRASDRNIAMVFQSYALYPHLTVRKNIATPLFLKELKWWQTLPFVKYFSHELKKKLANINERVESAAELLDISKLLERKPSELSGGQRQRVALGRALVRDPAAFLLDEPLSNLDAKLRIHMRSEIAQLHRKLKKTFIYVTHDQSEAMTMADRIVVIMDGEVLQCDTPNVVYNDPSDIRVAQFIGSPPVNILPATLLESLQQQENISHIGIRPESIRINQKEGDLKGKIQHVENLGAELLIYIENPEFPKKVIVKTDEEYWLTKINTEVFLEIDQYKTIYFDKNGKSITKREPLLEVANG
jgi:multiple sugar transport system ATP-binding protein